MNGSSENRHSDSERLVRLETEVDGMRQQFGGRFSTIESKLDLLTTSINESRRPRWDTWAAWLVLLVMVSGGGYVLVSDRFEAVEGRTERNYQLASQANHDLGSFRSATSEVLGEIETQFRAGGQINNLVEHRQDQLIDQLWKREFGYGLREDTPWPVLGKER